MAHHVVGSFPRSADLWAQPADGLHKQPQCSWPKLNETMSSKDGRDKMAQDQVESTPSFIEPVMEEFDMVAMQQEVDAAQADISDENFVELGSVVPASTDEPDPEDQTDEPVAASDEDGDLEEGNTDEAGATDEPEPTPEVVDGETGDEEGEDATDETGDEPEPEADEPELEENPKAKPGTSDKALQRLQQRQASFEKSISEKFDQLTELLSAKAPDQGQDEQPPAKEDEAPEPDNDELEAALAELQEIADADQDDVYDDVSKADLSKLAKTIAKAIGSRKEQAPAKAPEIEGLDEVMAFVEQAKREKATAEAWDGFEAEHGYDGRPVWKRALRDAARIYPADTEQNLRISLAQKYFDRRVEERAAGVEDTTEEPKAEPKAPTTKTKKVPVKPASSKPPKPTTGAQTAPTGARGAGRNKKSGGLPPIYVP